MNTPFVILRTLRAIDFELWQFQGRHADKTYCHGEFVILFSPSGNRLIAIANKKISQDISEDFWANITYTIELLTNANEFDFELKILNPEDVEYQKANGENDTTQAEMDAIGVQSRYIIEKHTGQQWISNNIMDSFAWNGQLHVMRNIAS